MDWKDRTRLLLEQKKMNQSDLARKLGLNKATVSVWLGNSTLTRKNILKAQHLIADILEVSPEYLARGTEQRDIIGRTVPVLKNRRGIRLWLDDSDDDSPAFDSEGVSWTYCPMACSERAYAFPMKGSAMENATDVHCYPDRCLLFIDPDYPLAPNHTCAFESKEIVVGVYEPFDGRGVLVFSNPRFQNLKISKRNYRGTVLGSFQYDRALQPNMQDQQEGMETSRTVRETEDYSF